MKSNSYYIKNRLNSTKKLTKKMDIICIIAPQKKLPQF